VTVIDAAGAADSVMVRLDGGAPVMSSMPVGQPACPINPCIHR
jgi:hypothetical protein